MADCMVTVDGVLLTDNGKSRVFKGRVLSLTDQERAANAHLFVVPEPAVVVAPVKMPEPPIAEVMKPVRHTPKADEPVRKGPKR